MTTDALRALRPDSAHSSVIADPPPLAAVFAAIEALARKFMGNNAPLDAERLQKEEALLRRYFPTFHIQFPQDPARAGVVGTLSTNAGNEYGLWIPLGAFPNEPPRMFVVSPQGLRKRRGRRLAKLGTNSNMHLLEPNEHGHPQICHHNDASWTPNITLFKVVMKGRLWLEAYEMHKATGKNIDHYLAHM